MEKSMTLLDDEVVNTKLIRRDGHSLQLGMIVEYRFQHFQFRVLISREGILIEGKSPMFDAKTLDTMKDILRRAEAHFKHLASFPIGERQTILDEDKIEYPEMFNGPRLVQ